MRVQVEAYLKQYGEWFRYKKLSVGMSQLAVATQIGVSQAIISHIETGHMLPPIELELELSNLYERMTKQ